MRPLTDQDIEDVKEEWRDAVEAFSALDLPAVLSLLERARWTKVDEEAASRQKARLHETASRVHPSRLPRA